MMYDHQREKEEVLLNSALKFLELADKRRAEKDYLEAVSILSETLVYVSPQIFMNSPMDIRDKMVKINVECYMKLSEILVEMGKGSMAVPYLKQVLENDPKNEKAQILLKSLEHS